MLHINHPTPTKRREAVIVGVTRMADKFCIGAVDTLSLEALRLLPPHGGRGWNPAADHPKLGQRIALVGRRSPEPPPHTEGFRVHTWRPLPPDPAWDLPPLGEPLPSAWLKRLEVQGDPLACWLGAPTATALGGSLYLPTSRPRPMGSVCFWRNASPLRLRQNPWGTKLQLPGGLSIKYVGRTEVEDGVLLPKGSILRLSLSGAYRPPEQEEGHFLQLSGWWAPPVDGWLSQEAK